jgi:Alginate lyase.
MKNVLVLLVLSMFLTSVPTACSAQKDGQKVEKRKKKRRKKVRLPKIDLTNWKVTLPIGDPLEYAYPAILDYAENDTLNKFMYADSSQGALVFYTYPSQTTKNTKYSRTELREQMVPGKNNVNWTFEQGGKMKATMAMESITKDDEGKYHKTIILQIHGRLTNEQRDRLGKDDNEPPQCSRFIGKMERLE